MLQVQLAQHLGEFKFDVDLEIALSGVTAIYGSSGAGKTTLLRGIAGLDRTLQGKVQIRDMVWQNESEFMPTHLRQLAYVFQEPSLFNHLDVHNNLRYGYKRRVTSSRSQMMDTAIELLGIGHLLKRSPENLSGGEKQRVAIARAISSHPQLILMDEPLAALDARRKQEVLPFLETLHQELDIPIIYVSHSLEEVTQLADQLVLLEQGSVLANGPIEQVITQLDLPLSHEYGIASIIETHLIDHDEQYGLSTLEFSSGQFSVPRLRKAVGSKVRIRLAAKDVSITLQQPQQTSILNIFQGVVAEVGASETPQVMLKVSVGDDMILAKLTKKSVDQLALKSGVTVFVQAKSVAVLA
jgi:molybdate transport system ATP-binding protein